MGTGYNPYRKANGEFATKEEVGAQVESDYTTALASGDATQIAEIEEFVVNNMDGTPLGQKILEKKFGTAPAKKVRYSFLKEFKQKEEAFDKSFEGFPNRFFNANLRGNFIHENFDVEGFIQNVEDLQEKGLNVNYYTAQDEELGGGKLYRDLARVDEKGIASRMFSTASAPQDLNVSDDDATKLAERLGLKNIHKIEDPSAAGSFNSSRMWYAEAEDGQQIAIVDSALNSKGFAKYSFRRNVPPFKRHFKVVDLRLMAGAERVERKTGRKLFQTIVRNNDATISVNPETHLHTVNKDARKGDAKLETLKTLRDLEGAQFEGANFRSQKKYVKEHSGTVATAWMDKKNPDKVHAELMKKTRLKKVFRKVEIDNDVDPAEYEDFVKAYEEVQDKLPKIPKGKEPELRLRKLGKHHASGMYFPHKNTVCIDVRTSGSFVHEMAHQYDLAIRNNASLSHEFRGIVSDYSKKLQVPAGEPASRKSYLTTPTEVFARSFENYCHSRLGIDNRLIDVRKFSNYDHAPIQDPEFREKAFAFFDKLLSEDN